MDPNHHTIFSQLEKEREILLSKIASLSDEQFQKAWISGKWSLSEIYTHLSVAEMLSVNYIKKKMLGVEQASNSGITEELKMVVLKISQRLPFLKFKAPTIVVSNTPKAFTKQELKENWDLVRSDLQQILETLPEEYKNRLVYKHAFAGRLNLAQAMLFFREHIIHHTPQINRLLTEIRKA